MRKFLWLPALALLFNILLAQSTFAHVLKMDGDTGAVLHIQPDDAPLAKIPVTYALSFQDSKEDFSLQQCACSIAFIMGGKTIATQSLHATSSTVSENTYTFPEVGAYTFRVTGSPRDTASFTPFTLDYTVRVGGAQMSHDIPPLLWLGMAMGIGLLLLSAYASEYPTGKETTQEKS